MLPTQAVHIVVILLELLKECKVKYFCRSFQGWGCNAKLGGKSLYMVGI